VALLAVNLETNEIKHCSKVTTGAFPTGRCLPKRGAIHTLDQPVFILLGGGVSGVALLAVHLETNEVKHCSKVRVFFFFITLKPRVE